VVGAKNRIGAYEIRIADHRLTDPYQLDGAAGKIILNPAVGDRAVGVDRQGTTKGIKLKMLQGESLLGGPDGHRVVEKKGGYGLDVESRVALDRQVLEPGDVAIDDVPRVGIRLDLNDVATLEGGRGQQAFERAEVVTPSAAPDTME
jgi:hypothetical protein